MTMNRRHFTQALAATAAVGTTPLAWANDTVKVGYVSPQTGPLAPFGEADRWVIDQMKVAFKDGIVIGGKKHAVEIVLKDRKASISYVQRKLKIGYNRAARLLEDMENAGLVSALTSSGQRDILVPSRVE